MESTWSPFQSAEVREICAHLTPTEHARLMEDARGREKLGSCLGRVLSFGQLLLDADDLLPQGHLQGEAPTKARNRFADNCVVQTAGRLAKLG